MKLKKFIPLFGLIFVLASVGAIKAQSKSARKVATRGPKAAAEETSVKDFREAFIKASEDYKISLQKLLELYENEVKKANDHTAKWKALYDDGLISRHEYESTAGEVAAAQVKVDDIRKQIANAELTIAEARRGPSELRNADMAYLSQNAPPWTTGNRRIDSLIRENGTRYGVDPYFIYCVIHQESGFSTTALSVKGAQGLMQLMPGTAARYGVTNPNDPAQNIRGGTRYLRDLLQLFNGRIDLALAGYNAGEGAVIKYGQAIPPYKETQDYVRLISKRYYGKSKPVETKPKPKVIG
jgi:soluble lytic murein transglycosylase-like protein